MGMADQGREQPASGPSRVSRPRRIGPVVEEGPCSCADRSVGAESTGRASRANLAAPMSPRCTMHA